MTKQAYYTHIRSLAAFPALDAWQLACSAAALDEASAARRAANQGPNQIWLESQDGAQTLRLSAGVSCF